MSESIRAMTRRIIACTMLLALLTVPALAQSSSSSTGDESSSSFSSSSTGAESSSSSSSSPSSSPSSSSSSSTAAGSSSSSSSGSATPSAAVPAFIATYANQYPIDWSLVPTVQPDLSIPDDTDLGTCICDLTWASCDVNCLCDTDCSLTEQNRFSTALPEGPKSEQVLMCVDPELVSINERGALTVTLVNNMLCVAEDNNPSLGRFLSAPTSLTDAQFSAARSSTRMGGGVNRFQFTQTDPLAVIAEASGSATDDTSYKVGDIITAARQDTSVTTSDVFYITHGGQLVVPTAGPGGTCSDSSYMRYLHSDTRRCLRRVTDLESACVAGGLLSGARYVANQKVGKLRTSTPTLPTQYVSANISGVWYKDASTGALTFLTSQTYGSTTVVMNGTTIPSSSSSSLPAFTFPEPTWNATSCTCHNVLQRVEFLVTHEAGGQVATSPAPNIRAFVTDVAAEGNCEGGGAAGAGEIEQTFETTWQLSNFVSSPPSIPIRPKSGNPGYLVGLPVLSGNLESQLITSIDALGNIVTSERQAVAQDIAGLTMLPISSSDQSCSTEATEDAPVQSVTFGQDAKFVCYLSLNLAELQALCGAGIGVGSVLPYFGNISSRVGVWGNSDFVDVNEWVEVAKGTPPVGTWFPSTRTCGGVTSALTLELATTDVGAFRNPQRRILAARVSYATSTWQFRGEDVSVRQKFPVAASVAFVLVEPDSINVYTPRAPPLLPKFPSDLLYPLYIESAASTRTGAAHASPVGGALLSVMATLIALCIATR